MTQTAVGVEDTIAAWAAARGWPTGGWVREYGRLEAGASVLGYAHPDGLAARVAVDAEGAVALAPPEADPALPGLAAVLRELRDPRILRYRPGHRCTLRGETPDGRRIVKVAPDGERHVAEAAQLWAVRAELPFAVARPFRWDPVTSAAWYSLVPGRPVVAELLGPDAAALVHRMGTALAGLARTTLRPQGRAGVAEQLARSRRAVDRAVRAAPGLAADLADALAALEAAAPPPRTAVPVHGAPHHHQWLADGDRLGLIDFDRFALGDPELDLATLLSELADEPTRRVPMDTLRAAGTTGYAAGAVPLEEQRLTLYLAHKRLGKACRVARAPRADAVPRARRHLTDARTLLQTADRELPLLAVAHRASCPGAVV